MFLIELSNTMKFCKQNNLYLDERRGLMKYMINQTFPKLAISLIAIYYKYYNIKAQSVQM